MMARYGPVCLLILPVAWALIIFAAFIPIYWGLGVTWREAMVDQRLIVHHPGVRPAGDDRGPRSPASSRR